MLTLDIVLISLIYFFTGYFCVKFIHVYHSSCPNLVTAIAAIIIWPVVMILFVIVYTIDNYTSDKTPLVDKFLGESKKNT